MHHLHHGQSDESLTMILSPY